MYKSDRELFTQTARFWTDTYAQEQGPMDEVSRWYYGTMVTSLKFTLVLLLLVIVHIRWQPRLKKVASLLP